LYYIVLFCVILILRTLTHLCIVSLLLTTCFRTSATVKKKLPRSSKPCGDQCVGVAP
jgi:hypothetical protein